MSAMISCRDFLAKLVIEMFDGQDSTVVMLLFFFDQAVAAVLFEVGAKTTSEECLIDWVAIGVIAIFGGLAERICLGS